jgi:V/A-type H+/Na+-transporting ATPase subunit I
MIAEMLKIQLAAPNSKGEELMTWLQEQEVLHVTESKKANNKSSNPKSTIDKELADVQFALDFINRIRNELNIQPKKSWRNMFAGKPMASLARLEQTITNLSIDTTNRKIRKISDELARLKAKEQELTDLIDHLHPWRDLHITGAQLKGSDNIRYMLLKMSVQEDLFVKRAMTDIKTAVWQDVRRVVTKKRGKIYLEVAVHHTETDKIEKIITATSAEVVNLSVPNKQTIADYFASLKEEDFQIKKTYKALLEKGKKFVRMEREVKFAYDGLLHRKEREAIALKGINLPRAMIITGWIPKHAYKEFTGLLEKEFPNAAIDIEKKPKETPPVALKNTKSMEPFEAVTNIYGKPKYSELDPTPPLSIFFLISFGLALTDAGYGIIMMLMMWLVEKYFRLKKEMQKMIRLLFYAGAATTVMGALTGGWFGITLENLPESTVKSVLLGFKVIDPVSNPMQLLVVAFAIGIVQLLFAWLVRAYDHARKKEYTAMLFDDIAWFVMVIVLLLWAGSSQGIILEEFTQPLKIGLLSIVAIVALTGGRSHKNPLLKIGAGVLSLYGLVSFLSDTLSYSRLLALGLATGIIALVVNMIAVMIGTSIPGVGWVIAVFVLLGGHIFNLGINALGAFIHSGRLQYVEFFPKFLEGGGLPYRPFGRVSKYVDNPKEFV